MYKKLNIVCIVPARGGSKGIPGKNIKELHGKPLIAYAIAAARASKYIDRIIVSTDDQKIADVAIAWGAQVPILRPSRLAQDSTPTLPAVLHMLEHLKRVEGYEPDMHVLIQPTSPLVQSEDIDRTIETLMRTKMDSCVTVSEVSQKPERMYALKGAALKPYVSKGKTAPRQKLPKLYHLNGAVYATLVKVLPKGIIAKRTSGVVMPLERSVDIDTMLDFAFADFLMSR